MGVRMQASADVAAWGEGWLSEWVSEPGLSDAETRQRRGQAALWQDRSLTNWLHFARAEDGLSDAAVDQFNARIAAANHARLYQRVPVGLLVWRMFAEYRKAGLDVPEAVLRKFDEWAARLETACGEGEVAAAIEMKGAAGGPQGAALLRTIERQRRIVSEVAILLELEVKPAEAIRRVAAEHGISVGAVRSACNRWKGTHTRGRVTPETEAFKALRTLGR